MLGEVHLRDVNVYDWTEDISIIIDEYLIVISDAAWTYNLKAA